MVDVARTRFPGDMTRAQQSGSEMLESATQELIERVKAYAREEPVAFACWAFGIGFVLGWRLKPW